MTHTESKPAMAEPAAAEPVTAADTTAADTTAADTAAADTAVARELHRLDMAVRRELGRGLPQMISPEIMGIVTGSNGHILHYIASHPDMPVYQKDIERVYGVTRSAASRTLALMEQNGLIERRGVQGDRRLKQLLLTEKARAVSEALQQNFLRVNRLLLEGIAPEEKAGFLALVNKMLVNLEPASNE